MKINGDDKFYFRGSVFAFFFNFIAVVSVRTHLEEKYLTSEKQRMSLLCFCLGKAFGEKVT